jgi:hypothetical protein
MTTAWVATGGSPPKVAPTKRRFVYTPYASAVLVVTVSIIVSYLISVGYFQRGIFVINRANEGSESIRATAEVELKVSHSASSCSNCENIPVDPADAETQPPTDEEFENDEEVKKIKSQMREEVESQATELGSSMYISESEWQSQAFKDTKTLQDRVKGALMGAYLADAASLGLQG